MLQKDTRMWLITDTHWNHENIIKYENRPDNHKDIAISNWKSLVKPKDRIIHLGDVIFHNRWELFEILESLPGYKILIYGNHDKRNSTKTWFRRAGFNEVHTSYTYKEFIFSHKPIDLAGYDPNIKYNIHGHFHTKIDSWKGYDFYDKQKHVLLSLEKEEYKPVELYDFMRGFEE